MHNPSRFSGLHRTPRRAPYYVWAPGDDGEIDTQRLQLPNARVFYDSVPALAAIGVPAPTFLHHCQEAAGTGTIFDVAGGGADLVANRDCRQGARTPVLWDPVNRNFHGYYRRGVECCYDSGALSGFVCGNPAIGDPGMDDFSIFLVFRRWSAYGGGGRFTLTWKKVGNNSGWIVTHDAFSSGIDFYLEDNFGVQRQIDSGTNPQVFRGPVVATYIHVSRTTASGILWMSSTPANNGWGAVADHSTLVGTITSPDPMRFFGGPGAVAFDDGISPFQILYHAMWIGANATTLGGGIGSLADYLLNERLWPHRLGCTNDSPYHGLCDNGAPSSSYNCCDALVGDDPLTGLCVGDFVRQSGGGDINADFAWRYDSQISRRSKLTAAIQCDSAETYTNLCTQSDQQDAAAVWTPTNAVVSALWADMADGPDGFHTARRITASADNGYIQDATTTVVGTVYNQAIMVRRGLLMGANVTGRLIAYNITGGAEIASVAFTATTLWQVVVLEFTAVSVSTGIRIEIDTNTESIHVARVTEHERGYNGVPVLRAVGYEWSAKQTYTRKMPLGYCLNAAQGEIELRARLDTQVPSHDEQWLIAVSTDGTSTANNNKRAIFLDTSNQIVARVYNNTGVLSATMTSAPIDMRTERLIRLRWDTAGLPSGNTIELIIDTAAPISGSVGVWTTGTTLRYYVIGSPGTNLGDKGWGGSISYVKVWPEPQ